MSLQYKGCQIVNRCLLLWTELPSGLQQIFPAINCSLAGGVYIWISCLTPFALYLLLWILCIAILTLLLLVLPSLIDYHWFAFILTGFLCCWLNLSSDWLHVSTSTMKSQQIVIATDIKGFPTQSNFKIEEVDLPALKDGGNIHV